MQARRGGARAPRRTSKIRPKPEVAPPAAGRDLRPFVRSKLASSLVKGSIPAPDTLTFPGTATPPCRGGRQTSLLAICAELPDHIDRGHTAATHTLLAASIQDKASFPSVTTASTLRALCSSGCFAWPCQPLVGRAAGTEVRSRTRGARVFKGAGAVGRPVQAAACMQKLAPHDFKSSAVPDLRCATRICCVAEIMQHQTHYRSPLTHEDILGRDSFEEGLHLELIPGFQPIRGDAGSPVSFSTLLPRTYRYS